jgi:hypothetical protein
MVGVYVANAKNGLKARAIMKQRRIAIFMQTKTKLKQTTMTNLSKAFAELRKKGYFARQNFWCCQTCGWAALTDEQAERAVFYNEQDYADYKRGQDVYLSWAGDGEFISQILTKHKLELEWDRSPSKRIMIKRKSII